MQTTLIYLIPVFLLFTLGMLLRRLQFAGTEHADFLLKFVFFITLPALILLKITQAPLGLDSLLLPFVNIAINLGCMLITLLVTSLMKLDRKTLGSMLISTMIINNAFIYPFVLIGYGDEGFVDIVLLDFGNSVMTATFTYALAFRYGQQGHATKTLIMKVFKTPLLWALLTAVILSVFSIPMPRVAEGFLEPLGQMTSPLILIALGIFFSPRVKGVALVATTVSIRMFAGLAIGLSIAKLFGFQGTTLAVIALCSAAPVGFNALTFSSLAKLNTEFTASVVSISIFIGVIYIPVLMYIFQV